MTIVESCATKSLVGLMKIEFRPITAAVIAVVLDSAAIAEGVRSRRLVRTQVAPAAAGAITISHR